MRINVDELYAASTKFSRYPMGLGEPRDILIRFLLYQRIYESTTSMNCSMVVPFLPPWIEQVVLEATKDPLAGGVVR